MIDMSRYHMVNEGAAITVYGRSNCSEDSICGKIYNGEVFTLLEEHSGYKTVYNIRYLNSKGVYDLGFIIGKTGGNLAYYGTSSHLNTVGDCYCFKLNASLLLMDNSNAYRGTLYKGDYIYTKSATAGATNPRNMGICAYRRAGEAVVTFDGFLTLDYAQTGSMINKNFCIGK